MVEKISSLNFGTVFIESHLNFKLTYYLVQRIKYICTELKKYEKTTRTQHY